MLLQAFPGYKLSLRLKDYDSPTMVGWPALRHCVFSELIQAALEIGDCRASVEYLCTAMHVLFEHLSPNQLKEMSALIEENATHLAEELDCVEGVAAEQPSGAGPSKVMQRMWFSFTKIPMLCEVKVEKLPPHMTPMRRQSDQSSSVFIYTPLEKGLAKRKQKKGLVSTGITWVEGDFSEAELYVYNPMPYELKLTNIGLLTDGVHFESHPSGHSLPADSGPHLIKVVGTPKSSGTLIIKGYTCSLLGVSSSCLFADLPRLKEANDGGYSVDVSPPLPRLHVSECGGLPRSPYLVTGGNSELHTSAVLRLLYGERKECLFRLRNVGGEKVEQLELALDWKRRAGGGGGGGQRLLQWDSSRLNSQLPIAPGDEALLTIVADAACVDPTDAASWSAVPLSPLPPHERNPSAASSRERTDSRSTSSLLECTLKLKYSGGRGMAAEYYRQCAMAIDVVLDPSVDILSKHIVSSSDREFALVLDVVNRSNTTLDLRLPSPPSSSSPSLLPVCLRPMGTTSITLAGAKCDFFATDTEVHACLSSVLQAVWSSSMAEGLLPTAHLRWSADELATARRPPVLLDVGFAPGETAAAALCWAAAANASGAEGAASPSFGVGVAVDVVVELCNQGSQALSNVTVKMDVHQSVVARSAVPPVVPSAIDRGFCVLLEQSTVLLKHCDSGARHTDIKTLVAFYPGRYVLHATCLSSSNVVLSKSAGLDFSVD